MTTQDLETARDFIDAFAAVLRPELAAEPSLAPFLTGLESLKTTAGRPTPRRNHPPAAIEHLAPSLEHLACPPTLSHSIRALAPLLRWYQVFDNSTAGDALPPGLAEGMVAAQLAGRIGMFETSQVICGLFLLAPGLHYPLHQHSASEIYYLCSGSLSIQHGRDGSPFTLGPGDWSITPSNRLHALQTSDKPCLLAFIWVGDLSGANWWWEESADGGWARVSWERGDDGSWRRTRREAVDAATLAEAGEA